MVRKLIISGVACGAAALALGGSWAAAGTTDADQVQTIVVKSELTSFHFVDVGPAGVSPGDETTYTKKLTTPAGSARARGGSAIDPHSDATLKSR